MLRQEQEVQAGVCSWKRRRGGGKKDLEKDNSINEDPETFYQKYFGEYILIYFKPNEFVWYKTKKDTKY